MVVIFTILLSSHPVQSQLQKNSIAYPCSATIILIQDNSDEKEPLALYMSHQSAKSDMGSFTSKGNLTVKRICAAGERGLPCRNEKLNVVLFGKAGLPELTMPDIFQESLVMIPAKAAKLERLIAESRVIDNANMSKIKQAIEYREATLHSKIVPIWKLNFVQMGKWNKAMMTSMVVGGLNINFRSNLPFHPQRSRLQCFHDRVREQGQYSALSPIRQRIRWISLLPC